MAHQHIVSDSDNHFIIDPVTRQLSTSSKKTILMKTDHNSEQFTFELPRTVEGHDMSTCNKVEVHYININNKTRQQSVGIYNVVDFGVDREDETKVTGTWLVSREATKYAGSLNFVLRFVCSSDGEVEDYSWSTAIYTGITIADGICNTEMVVEEYVDILRQWLNTIEEASSGTVFAISDDGTITNLVDTINGFSKQISDTNNGFAELENSVEEFKNSAEEFKNIINQDVSDFKESTEQSITEFENSVNQNNERLTNTVSGFDDRIKSVEDFATLFQEEHLSTGNLNSTVIGTEGTFYIRFNELLTTIESLTYRPGINLILTKPTQSMGYETIHFDVINKAITAVHISLSSQGILSASLGSLLSDGTYSKITDLVGTFYYRKLS